MEVYLDLVIILNFLVDFLLLLGTNRLSGFPCRQSAALWLPCWEGSTAAGVCCRDFAFWGAFFGGW